MLHDPDFTSYRRKRIKRIGSLVDFPCKVESSSTAHRCQVLDLLGKYEVNAGERRGEWSVRAANESNL